MTCDEAIRAIEAMLDREIDDDERLQLEAHLGGCESCRRETEERRAFSDRIGRDLNEAFRSSAPPSAPRIVIRPRRFPWARAAAIVLVGIAIGYVGSSTGLFSLPTAEAREVAGLSALKDAYEHRDHELVASLEREASELDRLAARVPAGPLKDASSLAVMYAATGLAPSEPLVLPPEPAARARAVALEMSSPSLARRGQAVLALRKMAAADAVHMDKQCTLLNGTNRTFTELWVKSVQAPSEPAVALDIEAGPVRVIQFRDARIRVESTAAAAPKVYEGVNLLEFRTRYRELAHRLSLRGVDGNFSVAGVYCNAPEVEDRLVVYVPAVVWSSPGAESGAVVEALSVHAVMAHCAAAGPTLEEGERKGLEVLRRIQGVSPALIAVHADPERVRRHLTVLRKVDLEGLAQVREKLNDELAELERRVAATEQRLECVRKAVVTLEALPR